MNARCLRGSEGSQEFFPKPTFKAIPEIYINSQFSILLPRAHIQHLLFPLPSKQPLKINTFMRNPPSQAINRQFNRRPKRTVRFYDQKIAARNTQSQIFYTVIYMYSPIFVFGVRGVVALGHENPVPSSDYVLVVDLRLEG